MFVSVSSSDDVLSPTLTISDNFSDSSIVFFDLSAKSFATEFIKSANA